jgi:septal ring factor EnvC (AmiA/AmiB activator)
MSTPGDGGTGPTGTPSAGNGDGGNVAPPTPTDPAADLAAQLAAAKKTAKDANAEAAALRKDAKAWRDSQAAQQTAEQQWNTQRSELETRAAAAEGQLARVQAAAAVGLPLDMAPRLQGSTPEELAADAKTLAGLLSASTQAAADQAAAAQSAQRQRPDPSQGNGGAGPLALNGDPIQEAVERALGIRK